MKKRYLEYDLARCLALLPMPLSHMAVVFGYGSGSCSTEAFNAVNWINFIASFGAALFMFCMGINVKFARHEDAKDLCSRGRKMFIYWFLLNVLRYIIPGIVSGLRTGTLAATLNFYAYECLHSDILNFATIYFFFFALMKKLNLKPLVMVGVTAAMSLIDQFFIPNIILENNYLDRLVGNFIYTGDGCACFCLTQWAIVPTCGYAFAHYFKQAEAKGKGEDFWRKAGLYGGIVFAVLVIVSLIAKVDIMNIIGNQAIDYNFELLGAAIVMSLLVVALYVLHMIALQIKGDKLKNLIMRFSASITIYYMLQWTIIMWASTIRRFITTGNMSNFAMFAVTVIAIVGSAVLALWYTDKKAAKKVKA